MQDGEKARFRAPRDLSDRDRDRDLAAVAPAGVDIAPAADHAALAAAQIARDVVVVFAAEGIRHQHAGALADDLVGTPAEQRFRGEVEAFYATPRIDHDNRIDGSVEHRIESGPGHDAAASHQRAINRPGRRAARTGQ